MSAQRHFHEMLPVGVVGPRNMVLTVSDLLPELQALIKAAMAHDPSKPTHMPSGALNYDITALQYAATAFKDRQNKIPPAPWTENERKAFLLAMSEL